MKNQKKIFQLSMILAIMLVTLNSCTVLLPAYQKSKGKGQVTHKEVMSRFQTKEQVFKAYGIPTRKDTYGNREIWFYDLGTQTRATATPFFGGAIGQSSTTRVFVEFQFIGENVTSWRSQGVDYSSGVSKSTWLGIGIALDSLLLLIALAAIAAS